VIDAPLTCGPSDFNFNNMTAFTEIKCGGSFTGGGTPKQFYPPSGCP